MFYCLHVHQLSKLLLNTGDNWSLSHLVSRLVESILMFFRGFLLSYGMHFLQFGWLASCRAIPALLLGTSENTVVSKMLTQKEIGVENKTMTSE